MSENSCLNRYLYPVICFAFAFFGTCVVATASGNKCLSLLSIIPFDKNFSFSLDYNEFLEMSEWRFDELDLNEDDLLSLEELPPGNIHESFEVKEEETTFDWDRFSIGLPAFFEFIDKSGDGKLTIPEYKSLCKDGWAF